MLRGKPKKDKVVQIVWLRWSKNMLGKTEKPVFNTFTDFELVEIFKNGSST